LLNQINWQTMVSNVLVAVITHKFAKTNGVGVVVGERL
jgi:hypothetical protein